MSEIKDNLRDMERPAAGRLIKAESRPDGQGGAVWLLTVRCPYCGFLHYIESGSVREFVGTHMPTPSCPNIDEVNEYDVYADPDSLLPNGQFNNWVSL